MFPFANLAAIKFTIFTLCVKLCYQNDNSTVVTLRNFRTLIRIRKDPLTAKNLRTGITMCQKMGFFNDRLGKGQNTFS